MSSRSWFRRWSGRQLYRTAVGLRFDPEQLIAELPTDPSEDPWGDNTLFPLSPPALRQALGVALAGIPLAYNCLTAARITRSVLRRLGEDAYLCLGNVLVGDDPLYTVTPEHFDEIVFLGAPPVRTHFWVESAGLTIDPTIFSTLATLGPAWTEGDRGIFIDQVGSDRFLGHRAYHRHPDFAFLPML